MTNQATLHKEWLLSMMYQLDIPFSILLSDLVLEFSIFYLQLQEFKFKPQLQQSLRLITFYSNTITTLKRYISSFNE